MHKKDRNIIPPATLHEAGTDIKTEANHAQSGYNTFVIILQHTCSQDSVAFAEQ